MSTIQIESMALVEDYKESIEYFTKYGNPLEKAVIEAVLSLTKGK